MLQAQMVLDQVISLVTTHWHKTYQRYMSVHHSFRRIANIF
ncbi:hypothetical protein ECMP0209401_5219 [Escherichia coli MP020940.1]|nr:hypothetical protein ECMP0209401_5219 [Escherichia coli MP020940.1]